MSAAFRLVRLCSTGVPAGREQHAETLLCHGAPREEAATCVQAARYAQLVIWRPSAPARTLVHGCTLALQAQGQLPCSFVQLNLPSSYWH